MTTKLESQITLEEKVGEGHFGSVHRARHDVHGEVAVKIYERLPEDTDETWAQRRDELLAEGQRLRIASHERIVRVLDVAHEEGKDRVYLLMEMSANGSVEGEYEEGPSPVQRVRDVISDAALGLRCIHNRNLVHRDLKPANLLRSPDNRVLIADFGLVTDRILVGYASGAGYTDHLAPEVWEDGVTSIRTDIWALGMTTYRLLHGQRFYETMPPPRLRVCEGGFARSLPWLPHIQDAWRRFIRKCMHDDPQYRFQNADEVLQALGTLPIAPSWRCWDDDHCTKWVTNRGNRVIEVEHEKLSARRHRWTARSRPADGNGRARQLDGSGGVVGKTAALGALKRFFDNQA